MPLSVTMTTDLHQALTKHLIRMDAQEDLCFALWHPSHGLRRRTGLLQDVILPVHGDRNVHGNVSFLPAYVERAISLALPRHAGIAFIHSHPSPGWQAMSQDDIRAEQSLAPTIQAATQLPLLGLTVGCDGAWSARFWNRIGHRRYDLNWCESVRIAGEWFNATYDNKQIPQPPFREELTRTVSAWGDEIQALIGRVRIGVVGAGSVGSIVAESLARMGVGQLILIDHDAVERVNLDRLLHAKSRDIGCAKVRVLAKALGASATAASFQALPIEYSIVESEGFRAALDCDILFSCVDRPWPRSVLNFIAYAHLIPVVDGGILIHSSRKRQGLIGADWKAHIATPPRRCLECLGQYDPGVVSTERDGYFDDPSYISNISSDHPIYRNENVFCFSLAAASLEILQLVSMIVRPSGISNTGAMAQHFVTGTIEQSYDKCNSGCFFQSIVALGDHAPVQVTGDHRVARDARSARQSKARRAWCKFQQMLRSHYVILPKNWARC